MLQFGNQPAETYSLNMVILQIISLTCGDFGAVFSFLGVALDFVSLPSGKNSPKGKTLPFMTQVCKLGICPLHIGVCYTNALEVSVQNPKLRVPISPKFARTEDEIRSQDENSTQQGRKGPNRFSDLDWASGDSPPSFEFALLTPSLLLIFLIKSSLVRITELSVKSPCLHPVFGPAFTPYPIFQWYPSCIYTLFSFKPYSYLPHF
jgi:hypothetical protein